MLPSIKQCGFLFTVFIYFILLLAGVPAALRVRAHSSGSGAAAYGVVGGGQVARRVL